MMSVKEYAESINISVAEVLKKCEELGIEVSNASDDLSDDDVINLDYAMNLISTEADVTLDEEDVIDEAVDDIMESSNIKTINDSNSKQKLKKRSSIQNSKEEYMNKRKQMYKNKDKLSKNAIDETIILYKDGMTVGELAEELKVASSEIIKKLIDLGLMVSVNQSIDYDNAELIALEYQKNLKREETQDVANFEEYEIIDK